MYSTYYIECFLRSLGHTLEVAVNTEPTISLRFRPHSDAVGFDPTSETLEARVL